MYRIIVIVVFIFSSITSFAKTMSISSLKKKGSIYFAWGYNKDYFSRSDIHFNNSGSDHYDFTLENLKATDRPGFSQILQTSFSIPQYVYRLGYYFNNTRDLGIEINFDHTKYVMIENQIAHLNGTIHGQYFDTDTLVTPDFLKFEHTNGANFLMINLLKKHKFYVSKNSQHAMSYVGKVGFGIVIPKTDVTLFGERLDNVFHVAGYVTGVETALRYEFRKYVFSEASLKGTFANYSNVLTVGTGKANHTFFTGEFIFTVGVQLPL